VFDRELPIAFGDVEILQERISDFLPEMQAVAGQAQQMPGKLHRRMETLTMRVPHSGI
jgi:hypothetical protein